VLVLVLALTWCVWPAEAQEPQKWRVRVWDDGSRYTMMIMVQPEMDHMLMRIHYQWWPNGDRTQPMEEWQIAPPIPPRVLHWMERRISKHLDRLEAEGVYVRPE
jgi:hypothetical protein